MVKNSWKCPLEQITYIEVMVYMSLVQFQELGQLLAALQYYALFLRKNLFLGAF